MPGASSQEVRNDLADGDGTRTVLRGVEDLKIPLQVFVYVKNGGDITAAVAVIWCRPDRNQV